MKKLIRGRMNEQMNKRIEEWVRGWINEWMSKMKRRVKGEDEWMNVFYVYEKRVDNVQNK